MRFIGRNTCFKNSLRVCLVDKIPAVANNNCVFLCLQPVHHVGGAFAANVIVDPVGKAPELGPELCVIQSETQTGIQRLVEPKKVE